MQAISCPHCHFVSCWSTKSVETTLISNHVKRSRSSTLLEVRAVVPACSISKRGQNSEEKILQSHCNGRRHLLSVMSGTALFTYLNRSFTACAAEEEISESAVPETIGPEVTAPEKPAASELTISEEAPVPEAPAEGNSLISKLLARSKANKEKNDKARLDDYYKRNYKEYFEYIEGTIRMKKSEELTEAEKGIIEWLKNNK